MLDQLLGERLAALTANERIWFRFLESPQPGIPPLLVSSWAQDPHRSVLRAATVFQRSEPGGRILNGAGWVTGDGHIDLHHRVLTPDHLGRVAAWLKGLRSPHGGLRGLAGLRVVVDGVPTGHPDLRRLASAPSRPGSTAASAETLARLAVGEGARIWGRGNRVVLVPGADDGDGRRFEALVVGAMLSGTSGPSGQGVVMRLPSERLVLGFLEPASEGADVLAAVIAAVAPEHPAFWELTTAPRVGLEEDLDGGFPALDTCDRATSSKRSAAVAAAGVWFTLSDPDGRPRLVLEKSESSLVSAVGSIGGDGPTARGRIKWADGRPQLRADVSFPRFTAHLRAFGRAQGPRWEGLAPFARARVHRAEAVR